ncbi:MAG: inositol phosphorylceramide synthase [Acidobacteria bacterium]|nr:inositol phosphorylceramide synthase [Acidobacteriota bacterium]MBI1984377.1 inositol phosphorylceramide synthase [Acidobacteriota bacterium]
MPSRSRLTLPFRLEDLVALTFFLLNLAIRIFFRGIRRENLSPADVLIIIPAVTLLLSKELVHYFVAGRGTDPDRASGLRGFVRPYWEILRDWFPFLVILLMYYSLWGEATLLLVTTDRDAELIAWDEWLFGCQASVAIQPIISPPLTAWMEFAYTFHILNIPIVACFIYLRRSRTRFREMMAGVLVISFFGLLGYLLVPAIGPMYTLRDQYTVPLSQPLAIVNRQIEFMDFARIKRDVFPSLHTGISFLVWLYAFRNSRRLFWILSPFILSLWVSTVYLRYHYLVDVVAGLVLAPLCFVLANWLFKRYGDVQFSIPLPAKWIERLGGVGLRVPVEEVPEKAEERP